MRQVLGRRERSAKRPATVQCYLLASRAAGLAEDARMRNGESK